MSGTIKKVFLVLGILVLCFIIWQLVFNDGGIIRTAYNAMANGVNTQWRKAAGDTADDLIPIWGEDDGADTNGDAFDIDTNVD